MPADTTHVGWSRARMGAGGSVTIPLIIYGFGLFMDSWAIVMKEEGRSWEQIANVGLFKACGYNTSLQVPRHAKLSECFSLFESGVPGWMRAVQVFAILCAFLLFVLDWIWIVASCHGKFTDKPYKYPILIMWVTTGIFLLIHPVIFACHIRPNKEVDDDDRSISITTRYWGAFIMHCLVAGTVNLLSLMVLCCYCMCKILD